MSHANGTAAKPVQESWLSAREIATQHGLPLQDTFNFLNQQSYRGENPLNRKARRAAKGPSIWTYNMSELLPRLPILKKKVKEKYKGQEAAITPAEQKQLTAKTEAKEKEEKRQKRNEYKRKWRKKQKLAAAKKQEVIRKSAMKSERQIAKVKKTLAKEKPSTLQVVGAMSQEQIQDMSALKRLVDRKHLPDHYMLMVVKNILRG